ncbi:MAG: hypothetical protein ACT4OI_11300 [Methanobacteriota archaeon]
MGEARRLLVGRTPWSFQDLPRPVEPEAYERAAEEVAGRLGRHPAVEAVYTDGRVHVPGISDLDVEIVLRKGHRLREIVGATKFSEGSRYVLMHAPHVSELDVFRYVAWLRRSIHGFRILAGSPVDFDPGPCSPEGTSLVAAFTAFHFLFHYLLRFGRNLADRRIDARILLCQVTSAGYVAQRLAAAGVPVAVSGPWDEARRLRESWFDEPLDQNLRALHACLARAYAVTFELGRNLGEWLEGRVAVLEGAPPGCRVDRSLGGIAFVNAERRVLLDASWRSARAGNRLASYLQLPPVQHLHPGVAAFLVAIACGEGPLSERVRARLFGPVRGWPTIPHDDARTVVTWLNREFEAALAGLAGPPPFHYGFPTRRKPHYLAKEVVAIALLDRDRRPLPPSDDARRSGRLGA